MQDDRTRRRFLHVSAAVLAVPCGTAASAVFAQEKPAQEEEEVGPAEDLMREHGVLNRILLIYEEAERRIRASQSLDPRQLERSATTIKNFIENYHEKLEEDYLFPRFEKAKRLTDLVATLRTQHAAKRDLLTRPSHYVLELEMQEGRNRVDPGGK